MIISKTLHWFQRAYRMGLTNRNIFILIILSFLATIELALINSVTTKPAPFFLQISLKAGSVNPAMGAKKTLDLNLGSFIIHLKDF